MIKIALVDDEQEFIIFEQEYIEHEFKRKRYEFTINTFLSGNVFLEACKNEAYDLVFLDIDILDYSGFEIAESIRELGKDTDIVFVSSHEHFVFSSIEYQPFQFIRKQYLKEELGNTIARFVKKYENEKRYISAIVAGEQKKIYLDEIMYLNSNKHDLCLHSTNEDMTFRGRILDREAELSNYNFIRVHSGYLVNLKHVVSVGKDLLQLENGESLPVSRNRSKDVKNAFQRYLRNQV